ncbi:MAG: DUF4215 domain-containing protein [Candidatus Pacearchaeota archaeon]|nr:DUF4215 domain-containing protein [Candidatus Pacearchaeota archaeon]
MSEKKRETKKGKRLLLILAAFAFTIILLGAASASSCLTQEGCCNMNLIKSADKQTVELGDTVTFTLKYKNIGNAVCTGGGVKIQDELDWNLEYLGEYSTNIKNDIDGAGIDFSWYEIPGFDEETNTLTWNAHAVSPGEEGTITFEVKVLEQQECGDFEIPNFFKDWSVQRGWQYSNTINILVDNDCYSPVCGNGILDEGEECDDGNLNNSDLCRNNCKFPYCGDGVKDANEQCDDHNNVNGDGCSSTCQTECLPYCGDGVLDIGEECDDHNNVNGDGCSAECETEFTPCIYNISVRYSYANSFGTGIAINNSETYNWVPETPAHLNQGIHKIRYYVDNHEPEDNNASITVKLDNTLLTLYYQNIDASHYKTLSLDTSNLECGSLHNISVQVQSESNQICSDDNTSDNYAKRAIYIDCEEEHYCGDGSLDSGEECDLGEDNGEMCTPAYGGICSYCSERCEEIVLTDGYCGDGIIQSQYEECDDGNLDNEDGCSAECDTEEEGFCIEDISIRKSYSNSFGTGIALGFENGTWLSALTPNITKGNYKIRYYIDNNIANTTNNAHIVVKLDSVILSEYNYTISKYHSKTLTLDANELECNSLHKISVKVDSQHNPICTPDNASDNYAERNFYVRCAGPVCGDGNLDIGEECDDGNTYDGDGCSANCDTEEVHYCGDGVLDIGEECDDGNLNNTDLCRNDCKLPYCGDGVLDIGEECDDYNNVNGDGCSSICQNECCLPCCGDGVVDIGEQCDDGNLNNLDLCRNNCVLPICGDGIVQAGEQCDDGNTVNTDACRNTCKLPYCGDGIKDSREYCDDGNQVNGDGCSKTCRFECLNGVCTPNITIEDFIPLVWQCDHRFVYDDGTEPGRISENGQELVERINNYAFEGEQIQWKVLVMDKNGIDKVKDVYVTVGGNIEANCKRLNEVVERIEPSCNARILEEEITEFNHETMAYYLCTLTVETPESMYGQSDITVEAEDLYGNLGTMSETESW